MPRTSSRPAALLASLALALTGLVATGGALAPASASELEPSFGTTLDPDATSPAPAAVPPGTLLFVKNHNVWIAKGDGTGQAQLTKDGTASDPYASPTQADNGTIVASKGYLVVRLDRNGAPLGSFTPPTLTSSAGSPIGGVPHHVAVSPDGSTIAYSQIGYQCPIGLSCGVRYATGYTSATGSAKSNKTYYRNASWVSSSRTVQSGGYLSNAMLHTLGASPVNWFNDEDIFADDTDLNELEVSRDGRWLIALRGYDTSTHVIWYEVNGSVGTQSPPALPTPRCTSATDPSFASPTLAPDGSAAAWEESDGIWIKSSLTSCASPQPALRIAGGSDPSWSAVAYKAPVKPAPPKSEVKKIAVTKAPKISGTAKVGKTLKAKKGSWKPAPTKYTYQWKRNGKAITKATKSTYKLKKADAGKKITVTVTASRSGYKKAAKTSKSVSVAAYNRKKPKIKKKPAARVGKTLKVTKGTWSGKPKLSYQWYRGSKKIKGATKTKYKITRADRGKKLRVKVTAKRAGAPKVSVWTARTKKVR